MNSSLHSADIATHLKIVMVAIAFSGIVALVGINATTSKPIFNHTLIDNTSIDGTHQDDEPTQGMAAVPAF